MNASLHFRAGTVALAAGLSLLAGCGGEASNGGPSPKASNGEHARNTVVVTAENLPPPAPKPTEPMTFDQTCVTAECHATYLVARVKHAPVAGRQCDACHESDTGAHKFPLKRKASETCTFCHDVGGKEKHQHQPMTEGGCLSCHDPHASSTKFLIKGASIGQLCRDCHDLPLMKYAHASYADGQCTVCHQPHESPNKSLLRGGEGDEFCFRCHQDLAKELNKWDNFVHEPATGSCTNCHSPHTSPAPALLQKPIKEHCSACHQGTADAMSKAQVAHGAIDDARSCANCHNPHVSSRRNLLRDSETKVCLTCHDEAMKKEDGTQVTAMAPVLARKQLHGPLRADNCSACHDSHGAPNANLLRAPFPDEFYTSFDLKKYDLCFRCHSAELVTLKETDKLTGFRDGSRNLHYVHVHRDDKGRTCRSCHAVHASNNPLHVADSVPFAGSNWQMPIGFEKKKNGGSCSPGCHEPMTYRRDASTGEAP